MTYQEETEQFINDSLEKGKSIKEIQQYLLSDFQNYARVTNIVFMYKYCNNKINKKLGRAGKVAGWRVGTLSSLNIPNNKHPQNRKPEDELTRYYDKGRMDWRSFHKDCFIIISMFQNPRTKEFFETPSEANIKRLKPKTKFQYVNRPDTEEEALKRKKIAQRLENKN